MSTPETFVLLHGAWHGAWCWRRVEPLLRAAGHRVFTPTQTGVGERCHLLSERITLETFAKDLTNVLEFEDLHEVILVGHSFGGITITAAADRMRSRIRSLVYLDALILQDGQSSFSVIPAELADARRRLARETSAGLSIPVPDPSALGVHDAADAAWLKARCTPHPISTYEDRLRIDGPIANGLPATYVAVKPDYAPLASSREFAKSQAGWKYVEIDAGHDAMVTSPKAVADLLLAV